MHMDFQTMLFRISVHLYFFSILKSECIYRHNPSAFSEAAKMIDHCIHFNSQPYIQLKTGEASLPRRLSR